eukprot:TRINITY_DN46248_c0_g1_i1.p1 TRINITY_DN46248_c0_g1~~TRINITY_DN46248_c0_g1_i1.p1  ORF type:complete len:608 (-),score=159.08 TRINITY_DN46248_c0_g1_i1:51-1874(-)
MALLFAFLVVAGVPPAAAIQVISSSSSSSSSAASSSLPSTPREGELAPEAPLPVSYVCPLLSRHLLVYDELPNGDGYKLRGRAAGVTDNVVQALPAGCQARSAAVQSILATRKHAKRESGRLPLIPYPALAHAQSGGEGGGFQLQGAALKVSSGTKLSEDNAAVALLKKAVGETKRKGGAINLTIDGSKLSEEGYEMDVEEQRISLTAGGEAGLSYGIRTLLQLVPTSGDAVLPRVHIEDSPRFAWRGLHLDESRHFFGVDAVKRLLEVMATYKLNRFHWHLTDDQGWRLPIKDYPALTEVGAVGVSGQKEAYTAEEIKELIRYAKARHIEVMPEVDVPGHVAAAIAAYPELGNTDSSAYTAPEHPLTEWGQSPYTLTPTEKSYEFLDKVFGRVTELFPFPYVHIGGDEADASQWDSSQTAQLAAQQDGASYVQSIFTRRLSTILSKAGRTIIGWDEIQHTDAVPEDLVVMAWRSAEEVDTAIRNGRKVINSNMDAYYFDHYQGSEWNEPEAICCYLPLSQVYEYDPMPSGLSKSEQELVLGGQGQLWSEYFPTATHMEYMAHPRSLALAERLWSPNEQIEDTEEFKERLEVRLADLEALGVNYKRL